MSLYNGDKKLYSIKAEMPSTPKSLMGHETKIKICLEL